MACDINGYKFMIYVHDVTVSAENGENNSPVNVINYLNVNTDIW